MKLTVITPEKIVLDSIVVTELLIPGAKGEMGILLGHAPLVSTLSSGILKYRVLKEQPFQEIAVSWGYCEVQSDKVIVLAESAETKAELNKEQTEKQLEIILSQLQNKLLSPKEIRELKQKEQTTKTLLELIK